MAEVSLYIHIPFCRSKCLYCNFYSSPLHSPAPQSGMALGFRPAGFSPRGSTSSNGIINSYIDVILKQIKGLEVKFSSIYIGGGTPTVLGSGLLKALLKGLSKLKHPGCEFTIEANPESLDKEKIRLFLASGINRVSVGVQSFKEKKLSVLGRPHTPREAIEKIALLKSLGLENINIDLIFGVSLESLTDWEEELKQAVTQPVTHISCYGLT